MEPPRSPRVIAGHVRNVLPQIDEVRMYQGFMEFSGPGLEFRVYFNGQVQAMGLPSLEAIEVLLAQIIGGEPYKGSGEV